jgi:hypothetical protein
MTPPGASFITSPRHFASRLMSRGSDITLGRIAASFWTLHLGLHVAIGQPFSFTTIRTLAFVLQPDKVTNPESKIWWFDAPEPGKSHMWLDFPVPMMTGKSGEFTAYVEVGKPGRYWLRVLDPDYGLKPKRFALVVRA